MAPGAFPLAHTWLQGGPAVAAVARAASLCVEAATTCIQACDGEGCIVTRPPSTADKIAQVEALIATATDLESLQR